ncbi:MAG: murein hydrolase activator EnvC [Candidatus Dormibacteria bacterium]
MGALSLITVTSLLFGTRATSADQITDQIAQDQQKQAQNAAQLQQLQAAIASDQAQIPQLQAVIAQLDTQINATQAQVTAAQVVLDRISADLTATQTRLVQAQTELADDKRRLGKELVVMYELQQRSTPINNLMTSGDFNDFFTQLINSQRIGDQESASVKQIQEKEHEIEADVSLISQEKSEQQKAVASLQAIRNQLAQEQGVKQAALVKVQADQANDQALQAQIQADNDALNAEVSSLNQQEAALQASGNSGGGSGQFAWPDSGPISQGFGCTQYFFEAYDSGCPYPHRFHNGIVIAGACGNNITAADGGVVNIEPFQGNGYGNYILLQHGNGWTTLYGHMSGFAVSNGQSVGRGQLIGWEGTTGNSTGCHLHFGINHNNQWVNPFDDLS